LSDDVEESEGCFLMVPKELKESSEWFDPAFHLANHFGLLNCSPQKSITLLRECMLTRLHYPYTENKDSSPQHTTGGN
jgi:hypothetical protein